MARSVDAWWSKSVSDTRVRARDQIRTSTGYEIKPLAIGMAAGIIFDATVIRALLVPALMRLLGEANWWMPNWTRVALRLSDRTPDREPAPQLAAQNT